jgi:F420H2 dehydrogenase subunit I
MFCGLCVDECPVECLKMGKKVTMAGWEREEIVKGPGDLAVKKSTEKEVARRSLSWRPKAKRKAVENAAEKKKAVKDKAATEGSKKAASEAA